ncbi:MAG TPA: DUF4097 family beta strand repeat-containing protein [Longimicrobiales bacterium]|nr:DUF4097 family beta strand repeat-containing protein [Longimicrobiales bacterium]
MITTLMAAGVLALAASQQQMDTTFAVRPGGELRLEAVNGSVTIDTWDRDAMRVRARHAGSTVIELERSGSEVSIDARHRGMPQAVTFQVTVPRNYQLDIEGMSLQITVTGLRGSATLENAHGAIVVRDVTGHVEIESVSGGVTVENVRGDISVSTVNQAISISGSRGDIDASTVNGSIVMRNVDSSAVDASTVNGLVEYFGTVHDDGDYFLGTHNGRITMGIPERANARVGIEARNGRVESDFPVRVDGAREGEHGFTLGSGSARIDLESYNGTIHLVRPRGR